MKIQISKHFVKDAKKIADKRILLKIKQIIEKAGEVEDLSQLTGIEEMSGYPNYYRCKFDYRYRIGIFLDAGTVQFLRVGRRESFYKKFP
ncbi:MAG: mRNA interferase RelE/StbE [Methyloprofundus sp.]|nr:MAG: mRNA interferase RelE/StbE [Methyloprofundus sp.]